MKKRVKRPWWGSCTAVTGLRVERLGSVGPASVCSAGRRPRSFVGRSVSADCARRNRPCQQAIRNNVRRRLRVTCVDRCCCCCSFVFPLPPPLFLRLCISFYFGFFWPCLPLYLVLPQSRSSADHTPPPLPWTQPFNRYLRVELVFFGFVVFFIVFTWWYPFSHLMGRCVFFLCGQVDFGGMNEVEEKKLRTNPQTTKRYWLKVDFFNGNRAVTTMRSTLKHSTKDQNENETSEGQVFFSIFEWS